MTTAKTKTKLWPPIHKLTYTSGKVGWQVACMLNGRRIRETFPTKEEAETRAAEIRVKIENEGAAAFALPDHLRVEAGQAAEKLKPYDGETITKAVDFYLDHCLRFRNAPAVSQVVEGFIQERQKLNQRARNLADVRQRLTKFSRTFGARKLAEITVEELAEWLRDPTWSARSQIHYRRRVSMLYDYAVKRRWCEVNTAMLVDPPETEDKDVECFSIQECAGILENAEAAGCLPYVVLSLFSGLRRAEIVRLHWQDVNLSARTITVGSAAAKKRSRRVVTINETAAVWLPLCAKARGPVITLSKQALDASLKELTKLAGLNKWKQNGLRHSFCSYHVAAYKDPVRTAYEAGNSAEIVNRHYRALVDEDAAKRFWGLRPVSDVAGNIVPLVVNN
ncbi:MAG TPA: tyrosine-type recombinase/integrase [Verrucomicrobiae bacterium]|nr:tyrosine-type recombinase/integrase [Verrucomicrobiae bacterium]